MVLSLMDSQVLSWLASADTLPPDIYYCYDTSYDPPSSYPVITSTRTASPLGCNEPRDQTHQYLSSDGAHTASHSS